jgi:hypothetical protein
MRLLLPISVLVLSLAGCGAAASLPADGSPSSFTSSLNGAIWHPEFGDQISPSMTNGFLTLPAPGESSTYVNGVMLVDVPDRDPVSLQTLVGFAEARADAAPLVFRLFVQDNGQFVLLSEVHVTDDSRTELMSGDLSLYRGENRLLLVSVSNETNSVLTRASMMSMPEFRTP